jgi:hypothetical protein
MTYIIKPLISSWQRQIILGTILGGSSLVKTEGRNCYLSMRGRNLGWIEYKSQAIDMLAPPNPFLTTKTGYFRWHSCCSPLLNDFYDLFYRNGKKTANMDVLNELRDIGLSIWFLDSGKIKDKELYMNTVYLGEDGTKIVNQYFREIDLISEVIGTKVHLDKPSTSKFIEIIVHLIPEFMYGSLQEML